MGQSETGAWSLRQVLDWTALPAGLEVTFRHSVWVPTTRALCLPVDGHSTRAAMMIADHLVLVEKEGAADPVEWASSHSAEERA